MEVWISMLSRFNHSAKKYMDIIIIWKEKYSLHVNSSWYATFTGAESSGLPH